MLFATLRVNDAVRQAGWQHQAGVEAGRPSSAARRSRACSRPRSPERRAGAGSLRLFEGFGLVGWLTAAIGFLVPAVAGAQAGGIQPASATTQTLSPAAPVIIPPTASAVRVTTNMGTFIVELQADRAPLTVQNFLRYVGEGFYTNTLFHRVVGSFVVQGGGHDATTLKLKPTHGYIVNESGNGLQNKRGTVGMARSDPAHSANAQFYINLADNSELDPLPTRWGYTVFGHVTEGMDVIDRMGVIATGSVGPFKSEAPLKPIIIEKVEALATASAAAAAAAASSASPPPAPAAGSSSPPPTEATPAPNGATPPPPADNAPPPPQ